MISAKKAFMKATAGLALTLALGLGAAACSSEKTSADISDYVGADNQAALTQTIAERSQDKPLYVMFFATWCSHCENMTKSFHSVQGSAPHSYEVLRVPVSVGDTPRTAQNPYPVLANTYGVTGFPDTHVFYKGHNVAHIRGARNSDQLLDEMNKVQKQIATVADVSVGEKQGITLSKVLNGVFDFGVSEAYAASALPVADQKAVVQYRGSDNADAIKKQVEDLSKKMPTFVMLSSPTCGYCDDLEARFNKAARKLAIPVKVFRVDVESYRAIARSMKFRNMTPDTRAYQNGKQVYDFMGALPYRNVVAGIKAMRAAIHQGALKPAP